MFIKNNERYSGSVHVYGLGFVQVVPITPGDNMQRSETKRSGCTQSLTAVGHLSYNVRFKSKTLKHLLIRRETLICTATRLLAANNYNLGE
jgi:hypothetical protein